MTARVQAVFLQAGDLVPLWLHQAPRAGVRAELAAEHRRPMDQPKLNAAVGCVLAVESVTDEQLMVSVQVSGIGELDVMVPTTFRTEIRTPLVDRQEAGA